MPCGATVAPSARQTMQSSCVTRRSARALVRLAYVCSQSKSNSNVDGAVVESQAAAGQSADVITKHHQLDLKRSLLRGRMGTEEEGKERQEREEGTGREGKGEQIAKF